jgi:long-chain acyl-CoA synthetase
VSSDTPSNSDIVAALTAPGQMFEMDRTTVNGIEMAVWKNAPATLRQIFDLSLNHGSKDFLLYEGQRVTFEEHYRTASTLAQRLIVDGVKKGDRVAIASRNLPEWIMAFWGTTVTGAVVVPLNAWWTTDELIYGLSDSGTSVLFVDDERLERIRPRLSELTDVRTIVVLSEDHLSDAQVRHSDSDSRVTSFSGFLGDVDPTAMPPDITIDTDDEATMFYTSGTTGHPKGALGTHRNANTNIMNLFFRGQVAAQRTGGADGRTSDQSANLLNVPLFHATGCLAVMTTSTIAGAKIVMMHHFDATKALELIQSERLTAIGGVPTIVMQILDHPDFDKYDTSSITSVSYGGAPAPPELVKRIKANFKVGQPGNGYGLTETSAGVCFNAGADYVAKPNSCGPVVPVCEVAIVPEDFEGDEPPEDRPIGPDVVGELWVKGPNVVKGYWNKPEATAKAFTKGWLHTGDIARIDDEDFIYIVDRAKDMIIRGGENIYSVIVEAAIFEHPDVSDCAVIGVPHPTLGEEVAAVIVLRPGRVIEAEEISRHVAARLGKFQVPTKIFFHSTPLPRNPQGKVLKRELRDSILQETSASM